MDKEILCSLRSMQDQATTISIANKRGYDDAHPQKSDVSAPTISRGTNVAPSATAPYFRSGRQTAKWNKFSSDSIRYQGVSEAEAAAADTRGAGEAPEEKN